MKFTYVAWDSEIASTNLAKQLLESKGYKVTIQPMEAKQCGHQLPQTQRMHPSLLGYQPLLVVMLNSTKVNSWTFEQTSTVPKLGWRCQST